MGLEILKTPVRSPRAKAFCEQLIGTIRRECLEWMIPLNERHLRCILQDWVGHYRRGRPHASLCPAFRKVQRRSMRHCRTGIGFDLTVASSRSLSSQIFITNTVLRRELRESSFGGVAIIADDTCTELTTSGGFSYTRLRITIPARPTPSLTAHS